MKLISVENWQVLQHKCDDNERGSEGENVINRLKEGKRSNHRKPREEKTSPSLPTTSFFVSAGGEARGKLVECVARW